MPANPDVTTIARAPRVGDVVKHRTSGNLYLVEERLTHGGLDNRTLAWGVVDLATGRYPNSLEPAEVDTVSTRVARQLRQEAGL